MYHESIDAERAAALAAMAANREAAEQEALAKPFRFEDLNGKPEPKSWGPVYPNLPGVEKWRKLEKKRELNDAEIRQYGASVGAAIRALQRRELCGVARTEINLKCTVINTSGTDSTAAGEAERYRLWVEVRLPAIRAERLAHAALRKAA
jgi:hypothetical protein